MPEAYKGNGRNKAGSVGWEAGWEVRQSLPNKMSLEQTAGK